MFAFIPPASGKTAAEKRVMSLIAEHPVLMFSKTYCGYCATAKQLIAAQSEAAPALHVVELDEDPQGDAMQAALAGYTGQHSVPNVFIGGAHLGGCDDTKAAAAGGGLKALLEASAAALRAVVAKAASAPQLAAAAAVPAAPAAGPVEFQQYGGALKTYDCHVSTGG